MEMTARLGLKVSIENGRLALSSRNGDDSPVGIESVLLVQPVGMSHSRNGDDSPVGIERHKFKRRYSLMKQVEMEMTARLGLKALSISSIILTVSLVEMEMTARLGLKVRS